MKMPWSKSAPATADVSPAATKSVTAEADRRDPTAPKGRPTPKRQARGPVAPPPTTGKEARARMRERQKERKAAGLPPEKRQASSAREERIQARDAGPERALVRNIVDSRRSISAAFPLFAILILVAMFTGLPTSNPQLYNYLSYAWLAFFVVIIAESFFLARTIGSAVRERFPNTDERAGSLKYYGIIRGLMMRRLRYPKPVVQPGETY